MKLRIVAPTKALLEDITREELDKLNKLLTYTNTSNQYQVKRHYNNKSWKIKNRDTWEKHLETLKQSIKKTLVFEDDTGFYIRPASIPYIEEHFNLEIINEISYPTPKPVAWSKSLPFELHPYQKESSINLIQEKHANVELCTSAGKSAILLKICRDTGFKTAIIAPSVSIFNELLEKFEKHLGRVNVGSFGDGKKVLGKRFTVCIGDSLVNIKPNTKEWDFFKNLDMLAVDESHLWGAETLDEICHGVLADVPYRVFFSGTQTRGDGGEKLLQSIIGKTVYKLKTSEAIKGGYIADHEFRIVDVESSNPNYYSKDPLQMKRVHFLNNKNIASFVAKLANAEATVHKKQTLVLVEELNQISMLLPLLKVPYAIAHSETKPARLSELGLEKVDPAESVEKFNKGEAMVLVGTSCIATGTNIFPTHNTANWVGGSSEIKTKQGAVGRSCRLHTHNPWADRCVLKNKSIIWDFNVYDNDLMVKHLQERIKFYKESGTEIKSIRLK